MSLDPSDAHAPAEQRDLLSAANAAQAQRSDQLRNLQPLADALTGWNQGSAQIL